MALETIEVLALLNDKVSKNIRVKTLGVIGNLDSGSRVALLTKDDFAVTHRLMTRFEQLTENDQDEAEEIMKLLVNSVLPDSSLTVRLIDNEKFIAQLLAKYLCNEKMERTCPARNLSAMLLSNLTINQKECEEFVRHLRGDESKDKLDGLLDIMTADVIRKITSTDSSSKCNQRDAVESRRHSAYIVRNLTQTGDVRRVMVTGEDSEGRVLARLLPVLGHPDEMLRLAVVDVVRNCSLDPGLHSHMISIGTDELLSAVLNPLLGGEQLTDEENDALPIDSQYAQSDKQREPNVHIRVKLLEILYQLCTTGRVREYLRNRGTYYVLREYHKWELAHVSTSHPESTKADTLCANVIGVLIRTEDEMGCDDLSALTLSDA